MKSRFLNVSPRAFLRQKDSENTMPAIERTGDQNRLGNEEIGFSENNNTFIFENRVVQAPYMLPAGRAALSGFLMGTLVFSASVTDKNAYFEKAILGSQIYPYKEENVVAFGAPGSGFPEEIYPGFSSADKHKSVIKFDLSISSDVDVYKLNAGESARDPFCPFLGENRSGFMYFNKNTKTWADVGIRDSATNSAKDYNPALLLIDEQLSTGHYTVLNDSTDGILCQFAGSPYGIFSEAPYYVPKDIDALKARGYHRIGEPTSFFGAPFSAKYHAREAESFSLRDYIASPFVVDRITVNLPVTAFRTQVRHATTDFGFAHDIENYVFFVYVQNRTNATKDSKQDVSSSMRYLIAKESFCFYNTNTLDEVIPGLSPIHSNGKSISFSMTKTNPPPGPAVVQSINADMLLNFRPKTFNNGFGTISKMAAAGVVDASTIPPTVVTGSVLIANFWKGGQYASGTLGNTYGVPTTLFLNARSGSDPTYQKDLFANPSPRSLFSSFWEGSKNQINSGSGIGEAEQEVLTVTIENPAKETPVILFPDDELIFGIESGVNPVMEAPGRTGLGYDNDVLNMTGSRLVIRSGDASVSLYGTNVAFGKESLPELNQYLGSDAIHEDLHEAGPFDQFDILAPKILSGSYVDNIIGIVSGLRKRVAFASRGQGWITGSLQRNVRMADIERTYYDTFVPLEEIIVNGLEGTEFRTQFGEKAIVMLNSPPNGYAVQNIRDNNVLLSRPFTFEKEAGQARKRNIVVSQFIDPATPTFVNRFTRDESRFALYYNGDNPRVPLSTLDKSEKIGARSLRYGLSNVILTNPSAVFRRDKYGQVRDMLEQSRDAKFVFTKNGKDSVARSTVVATFVSSSSDIVADGIHTQCSNLSIECTSSLPFVDDDTAHNRGALPSYVVQFGPNNLIFGVTGSFGRQ